METSHHKLLALGLPRSGSRFLTKVLRNCGIKVGHESFKRDGTIGMFFAAEDCWYPGKHWYGPDESKQHRSDFSFDQVWHYIRDPRLVIPSMASEQLPGNIWCWQERHTGISAGVFPKKLRAMRLWVAWNKLIEQNERIDLSFRVEDIDRHWPDMCGRLGIEGHEKPPEVARDYGTVEHGPRKTVPMTWDEMKSIDAEVAKEIRDMAERYGYEV